MSNVQNNAGIVFSNYKLTLDHLGLHKTFLKRKIWKHLKILKKSALLLFFGLFCKGKKENRLNSRSEIVFLEKKVEKSTNYNSPPPRGGVHCLHIVYTPLHFVGSTIFPGGEIVYTLLTPPPRGGSVYSITVAPPG